MTTKTQKSDRKIPIIICVGVNGRAVVYGYADRIPEPGEKVALTDARMILKFGTVGGLFGLATTGPASDTRLTAPVEHTGAIVQQILTVSTEAARRLDDAEIYR